MYKQQKEGAFFLRHAIVPEANEIGEYVRSEMKLKSQEIVFFFLLCSALAPVAIPIKFQSSRYLPLFFFIPSMLKTDINKVGVLEKSMNFIIESPFFERFRYYLVTCVDQRCHKNVYLIYGAL